MSKDDILDMEFMAKIHVSYTYEDFAYNGFSHIAYYDDDDEVVVVSEPELDDYIKLWEELSEGWNGEIVGYYDENGR